MLKKLGIGGAFALAAAAVAVGCSSSKSSGGGVFGTNFNPELSGTDNFPASPIAQNNLAPDGGGFTHNAQDFVEIKAVVNAKPNDDAPRVSADGSVMLFFSTVDTQAYDAGGPGNANSNTGNSSNTNAPAKANRYWVSYFDGNSSTLTPPVEITGVDRDEDDTQVWTNVAATVMVPINTQSFVDSSGTNIQAVTQNNGNWLILWDAETWNQNTALLVPGDPSSTLQAASGGNAQGAHHTIYATVFLKQLKNQPTAQSAVVGNTATSGPPNVAAQEFRYGFQVQGTEVPVNRSGASIHINDGNLVGVTSTNSLGLNPISVVGNTTGVTVGNLPTNGGFDYKPAEDVISFGIASDTLVGPANWNTAVLSTTGGNGAPAGNNAASVPAVAALDAISGPTGLVPNKTVGTVAGAAAASATIPGVTYWAYTFAGGAISGGPFKFRRNGCCWPGSATYTVGDDTTFIQLFYVQMVTSAAGQTLSLSPSAVGVTKKDNTVALGPAYKLFTANFNLASLTFNTPTPVVIAAPITGNPSAALTATTAQPLPHFRTYNNLVFWQYIDASLAVGAGGSTASNVGIDEAVVEQRSQVQVVGSVGVGLAGAASLSAVQLEVTRAGTGFKHKVGTVGASPRDARTSNAIGAGAASVSGIAAGAGGGVAGAVNYQAKSVSVGFGSNSIVGTGSGAGWITPGNYVAGSNIVTGDEFVEFPDESRFTQTGRAAHGASGSNTALLTFGPDDGACDITTLYTSRVTTNGGSATVDEDYELIGIAFTAAGAAIAGETGPQVLSSHKPEPDPDHSLDAGTVPIVNTKIDNDFPRFTNPRPNVILRDDVFDVKPNMSRDGTYVLIGYRQAQGTSLSQQTALLATIVKLFRCAACNSGASSTTTTAPTLAQRFPTSPMGSGTTPVAGSGVTVNTLATTAYAQSPTSSSLFVVNESQTTTGSQPLVFQGRNFSFAAAGPAVQAYKFQPIGYRCGFQGNADRSTVLWAHGDGSDDRVFVRTIVVSGVHEAASTATTNPALAFAAAESELEQTPSVQGFGTEVALSFNGGATIGGQFYFQNNNPPFRTAYHFLPFSAVTIPFVTGGTTNAAGIGGPGNGTSPGPDKGMPVNGDQVGLFPTSLTGLEKITSYNLANPLSKFGTSTLGEQGRDVPSSPNSLSGTAIGAGTFGSVANFIKNANIPFPGDGGFGYTFVENPGNGLAKFTLLDVGGDSSGANTGSVMLLFDKVTDGTTSDGNGFNQQVIAALYNNTSITDRVVISRRLRIVGGIDQGENLAPGVTKAGTALSAGLGQSSFALPTFDTKLVTTQLVPRSNDLCKATYSANQLYVYVNAPANDNGGNASGLWARQFDLTKRRQTGTVVTFAGAFTPGVDTSTVPTTNNYQDPTRLDNQLGSNAVFLNALTSGQQQIILFSQDNHMWGSITNDGISYSNKQGKPAPNLVDNNLSTTTVAIATTLFATVTDNNCDNLHHSIIGFVKDDTDKSKRLYIRIMQ